MSKKAKTDGPKYPKVKVQLSGADGNSFFILGQVRRALEKAGVPDAEQKAFMDEATAGDYDHLLQVVMAWVAVR